MNTRMRHRGVAIITALVLVALMGVVILAMTALLASDARRTSDAQTRAQLHELLRIAAADAQVRLERAPSNAIDVAIPLPEVLDDDGGSLRYSVAIDGAAARVDATATYAESTARQALTFTRDANTWRLTAATLE